MAINFINREDREFAIQKGNTLVSPGKSCYICFNGFQGGIQIHIEGSGIAEYMPSVTLYQDEDIFDETAFFNDLSDTILSDVDKDFSIFAGPYCVKVENKETSTDNINVLWSFSK